MKKTTSIKINEKNYGKLRKELDNNETDNHISECNKLSHEEYKTKDLLVNQLGTMQ